MITKVNKHHLDILIENETYELTQEQIQWLKNYVEGTWEYKNGVVNVTKGDVYFGGNKGVIIPIQFGKVRGNFDCSLCDFSSTKNFPKTIGKNLWVIGNKFTTFKSFLSLRIKGQLMCYDNPFILNNELFEDIAYFNLTKYAAIGWYDVLLKGLKQQIPIQFGVTDETIIEEIWQSYMNILQTGKNK